MSFGDDVLDAPRRAADPVERWPEFAGAVRARLEMGRAAYGEATFERPLPEVADELGAELLDQAAYAFIGWARLQALKVRLAGFEAQVADQVASRPKRLTGPDRGRG